MTKHILNLTVCTVEFNGTTCCSVVQRYPNLKHGVQVAEAHSGQMLQPYLPRLL